MKRIAFVFCCVAVSAMAGLGGCSASANVSLAEQAVTTFHQQLDSGQSDAIYVGSGDEMKKATTHDQLVALLDAVHRKLGNTKTSTEKNWGINYVNGSSFVNLTYTTQYTGGEASELFTYKIQDGKPLLVGFRINSNALVVN